MEGKQTGTLDPDFGRALGGRDPRRRASRERTPSRRSTVAVPARSDVADRRPGLHAAVPRRAGRQGHLARRDRRVHQRDRAVPQPVAVPARQDARRDRRRVQGADPADAARRSSTRPRPRARSCPRSRGATSRSTPRATTSSSGPTTTGATERLRFPFPRQRKDRFLCIADFFRPRRVGRRRLRRLPRRHRGRPRPRERERELFAADQYQEYLLVPRAVGRDDRGAGRALAPPHPRGVGLRRRGRPDARRASSASSTAARATRGATPRAPTSRTRPSSTSCSTCRASA